MNSLLMTCSYLIVFSLFIATSYADSDSSRVRALINTALDNRGQTIYDTQIGKLGKISGGELCGIVDNAGEINNLKICAAGRVTGGRATGTIVNDGVLCDISLSQNAQINGGTLCGLIQNQGIIANVTLQADTVIKGGTLQGNIQGDATHPAYLGALTVAAGSELCGVKLSPTVQLAQNVQLCDDVIRPKNPKKPSLLDFNIDVKILEQLDVQQLPRLEEEAFKLFTARHLARLSPSLFAAMNTNHIKNLTWKAVHGITIEQFSQLSHELLAAFTEENLGGLSPDIVYLLTVEQLGYLKSVIKKLSDREVSMFLTNVSSDMPISELVELVPKGWYLDEKTGELLSPKQAKKSFKKFNNQKNVPSQVDLEYDLPDMNTGLAVAGETKRMTLLQQIQLAINKSGLGEFVMTQQADGILLVTNGTTELTLIPDTFTMQQLDSDTPIGVSVNANGNYQVVTMDYTQITLVPVPKKFNDLTNLFGKDSHVKCNKRGDALLQIPTHYLRRGRGGEETNMVSIFDPFVEPAPEEFCQDDVCDWTGADESLQPGIVALDDNSRARKISKIIYTDGTSQKMYPTVLQPDVFIEEALKIAGVEEVVFNQDGTFGVRYHAQQFRLYPSSQIQIITLEEGEAFEPQVIVNSDNTVSYQVQDEANVFAFQLAIGI